MEENKDTQTTTQTKTYSEEEYNALKGQLDDANKTIQSYKDMDIEGIKQSVEDYKAKYEKSESDRKAFEHKSKIGSYVKALGLRDDVYEKHIENLLIEKGLQFEGEKLIGGEDIVKSFKEKYAHAFKGYDGNTPTAIFTQPLSKTNVDVTIDDFRKMGIKDRMKLKSDNLELYTAFKNN